MEAQRPFYSCRKLVILSFFNLGMHLAISFVNKASVTSNHKITCQ
uniref:Uncharacterized protein n=1 Tax=Rhizophora mucronata TaxID=61149 RepID=A0A2P2N5G1_RHIMU